MADMNSLIRYSLRENTLEGRSAAPFTARVHRNGTITQDQLINLMADRNTTVSRQDILVVLDLLRDVVLKQVLMGQRVVTDIFKVSAGIRGGFDSAEDEYDPGRHDVRVNTCAAATFRKQVAFFARTSKVRSEVPAPVLDKVTDFRTDAEGTATPGATAELKGIRLGWDEEAPEQGLWFVHPETGEDVPVSRVNRATATRVLFEVPADLTGGTWDLELRTAFGRSLRTGRLTGLNVA